MNNSIKKKLMISLATATVLSTIGTIPSYAFGETSESSVLFKTDIPNQQSYQDWNISEWNDNAEMDSGKIVLTPGNTEKDLNFAWYSETKGVPQVKMATVKDMNDATVFKGTSTSIHKTNGWVTYTASNKVSANNYLKENTTYYYQYSVDGITWSDIYQYQTHSFSSFQAVLVGDPQIGASDSKTQGTQDDQDIAMNTYTWNKTLETALGENGIAKDASFILSAGDQIDYSSGEGTGYMIREQEYAGFLYPSELRSIPLATTIGNHESLGDDYSLHYNNPNASVLGSTTSGGDYYYSYGDVLFISLNSNSRNVEEHRSLMQKAIESHSDAKWKVVMFHHDIYGSGSPHSDVDGANLRILFAPLMDEFDIDLCLTGHDHSYARTYQILDGKVIETDGVSENESTAYNPEGTLYIAAGSASGSKFYTLNTTKQYYIAERSNTQLPTFSTIDFSSNQLTIKTYDYDGNKYAYDVTLKKDDNVRSIQETTDQVNSIDTTKLTTGSQKRIEEALNNVNTLLDQRDDSDAQNTLVSLWNTVQDPLNYYAYAQNGYQSETSTALKQGFSTLLDKTLYENDTNQAVTSSNLEKAYQLLDEAKSEAVSIEEYESLQKELEEAQKLVEKAIVGQEKGQYTQESVDAFKEKIKELQSLMNEETITKTQLESINETLQDNLKIFKDSILTETKEEVKDTQTGLNQTSTTVNKDNAIVNTSDSTPIMIFVSMSILSMLGISIVQFLKKIKQ